MESLVFRFIRDIKNKSNDDIIVIRPNLTGSYSVVSNFGDNNRINNMTVSYMNMFGYIHSMMTLIINDSIPFQSVQIDVPSIPSVVIPIDKLDTIHISNSINTLLHVTLDSWLHTV